MTCSTQLRPAQERPPRQGFLTLLTWAVALRAGIVAFILGTVLTIANQFDAVFGDSAIVLLSLSLGYATPFVVVTFSQLLGMRRAVLDVSQDTASVLASGSFLATTLSHGIPRRALLLGAMVGTVNTLIVAAATYAEHGDYGSLPTALIAQAFVLPVLFGVLSQAISYRRAARAFSSPWPA